MSKTWTAAQLAAIRTKRKTILVSAAAGSGKTATLTERIIRSLTDPVAPADLSKMLIVTFTRSAADELKSRIFNALSEALAKDPANRHLTSQLIQVESAKICTIDAFYLELLRENFSVLGLSSSFRVADTAELEILKKSTMDETIDSFYEKDEEFPAFAECFTGIRTTNSLADTLLDLEEQIASVPEGVSFLAKQAEIMLRQKENDFFSTDFGILLREHCKDIVQHCLSIFTVACDTLSTDPSIAEALLPSFSYDKNFCSDLLSALQNSENGYADAQELLSTFSPIRLKRLKPDLITEDIEKLKTLRTDLHAKLRTMKKKSFSKSPEHIQFAMRDTASVTQKLYRVLSEYEQRISEEKHRRNIVDFHDIRRYTLRLLVTEDGSPTPLALQYAQQFSDIYIDEYQDVDRVQDLIFRSIARNDNRFMVGDIKQSIYSFRGAEPKVFAEYRASFPDYAATESNHSDGVTIFMSENFRCDQSVIDFTNCICSRIFSACSESIGYGAEDDLVFSKTPPTEEYRAPAVQVSVISNLKQKETETEINVTEATDSEEEAPSSKELEAMYIAKEIQRLITDEKKSDGSPIVPGDIAVLFRSRSMSAYLVRALNRQGILTSECDGDRYFENPDVLMVLCLLNTIDNPHRDIFLTGTLCSPLFGFTLNDLIQIRSNSDASFSLYDALVAYQNQPDELGRRCSNFDKLLHEWRQTSVSLPVDRFLRILFDSELFLSSALFSAPNELGEGGNLLRLYEYARTFEAGSFKGLYNFIEFINLQIEEGKKIKVPPKGISADRVNLMTVHQSKGLEFPVCFLCGTGNRFNKKDQYADLLFDYPTGIAMKIVDSTGFARINTPMHEALAINTEIKRNEEEMRVLYVALTRARERLYITASSSRNEESLMNKASVRAEFCDRHVLLHCNSYLDWILIPFADKNICTDAFHLSFLTEKEVLTEQDAAKLPSSSPNISDTDEKLEHMLKEKFAFQYPYRHLRRVPAKLSVSRLSPDTLDFSDDAAELFPSVVRSTIPDFFLESHSDRSNAAERGTATHLFLQFCDFSYAKEHGIINEIARLTEHGFLPPNLAELIYAEELQAFLTGDLLKRIECAKTVIREQRFNILMSPDLFTRDTSLRKQLQEERLAVQGVIDLILIGQDDSVELYDYKTDRLSEKELNDPKLAEEKMNTLHSLQLSYYAHAVSLLFNKPCNRVAVYSTHAGKLFPIQLQPLAASVEISDCFGQVPNRI